MVAVEDDMQESIWAGGVGGLQRAPETVPCLGGEDQEVDVG